METKPTIWTREVVKAKLLEMEELAENDENIYFLTQLMRKVKIPSQRLYEKISEYGKDDKEFLELTENIKKILSDKIALGALEGKFNATFSIFAMKNVSDWTDRRELQTNINVSYELDAGQRQMIAQRFSGLLGSGAVEAEIEESSNQE